MLSEVVLMCTAGYELPVLTVLYHIHNTHVSNPQSQDYFKILGSGDSYIGFLLIFVWLYGEKQLQPVSHLERLRKNLGNTALGYDQKLQQLLSITK
jgi:hypothetical protein